MAVYRPRRRVNPILLIILGAVLTLVIVAVIVVLLRQRFCSDPCGKYAAAQLGAYEAATSLDAFEIEYPKQTSSGAGPAFASANSMFASVKNQLAELDPTRTAQITADLSTLSDKVKASAPSDEVTALAEKIKQQLLAFNSGH